MCSAGRSNYHHQKYSPLESTLTSRVSPFLCVGRQIRSQVLRQLFFMETVSDLWSWSNCLARRFSFFFFFPFFLSFFFFLIKKLFLGLLFDWIIKLQFANLFSSLLSFFDVVTFLFVCLFATVRLMSFGLYISWTLLLFLF